jgi:Ca-activated chloride channel family protein
VTGSTVATGATGATGSAPVAGATSEATNESVVMMTEMETPPVQAEPEKPRAEIMALESNHDASPAPPHPQLPNPNLVQTGNGGTPPAEVVVPPDILAKAKLGDHWEAGKPDTQYNLLGRPANEGEDKGSGNLLSGGGNVEVEDVIGIGGQASQGFGGGWGCGNGTGVGIANGGVRKLTVTRHGGSKVTENAAKKATDAISNNTLGVAPNQDVSIEKKDNNARIVVADKILFAGVEADEKGQVATGKGGVDGVGADEAWRTTRVGRKYQEITADAIMSYQNDPWKKVLEDGKGYSTWHGPIEHKDEKEVSIASKDDTIPGNRFNDDGGYNFNRMLEPYGWFKGDGPIGEKEVSITAKDTTRKQVAILAQDQADKDKLESANKALAEQNTELAEKNAAAQISVFQNSQIQPLGRAKRFAVQGASFNGTVEISVQPRDGAINPNAPLQPKTVAESPGIYETLQDSPSEVAGLNTNKQYDARDINVTDYNTLYGLLTPEKTPGMLNRTVVAPHLHWKARMLDDMDAYHAESTGDIKENQPSEKQRSWDDVDEAFIGTDALITYPSNWHEISQQKAPEMQNQTAAVPPKDDVFVDSHYNSDGQPDRKTLETILGRRAEWTNQATEVPVEINNEIGDKLKNVIRKEHNAIQPTDKEAAKEEITRFQKVIDKVQPNRTVPGGSVENQQNLEPDDFGGDKGLPSMTFNDVRAGGIRANGIRENWGAGRNVIDLGVTEAPVNALGGTLGTVGVMVDHVIDFNEQDSAPGATVKTKDGRLTIGGLLQAWYNNPQTNLAELKLGLPQRTLNLLAAERLLRGYNYFHSENPLLTLNAYARRPMPVPPPLLTDEGMLEDDYIEKYGVRPYVDSARCKFSTFGLDVDTASYTQARLKLRNNQLPDPQTVRVEEFVNYFKQSYSVSGDEAFGVFAEGGPSLFGGSSGLEILKIGVKSRQPRPDERKPAVLTFVVDTSGSMDHGGRLELIRQALQTVAAGLRPEDALCIVGFAQQAQVVLTRTSGRQQQRILDAINTLSANGGTNVEAGLLLGYRLADEAFSPDAVNRVILCSDGVANIGAQGPDEMLKLVKIFAARGIDLATVGFGQGQYNDQMMQRLADNGGGACYFVDTPAETAKVFSEQLPLHLTALARGAKAQVEFNPEVVERFRLLGYEKRKIATQDFRNDKVEGGEVGHDTLVTALYEVKRRPQSHGVLGKVFLRWKDAAFRHQPWVERNYPLSEGILVGEVAQESAQLRFLECIARFADLLRNNPWARAGSYADVLAGLYALPPEFRERADWKEVAELVAKARELAVAQMRLAK